MRDNPPNEFREKGPHMMIWDSTDADGMNGAFSIPLKGFGHKVIANCIVSDGTDPDAIKAGFGGWEHCSVHINEFGTQRIPTWREMVAVKEIFWKDEEVVVEFHPAKSNYVNLHPCVLHLWRRTEGFPTPPIELV